MSTPLTPAAQAVIDAAFLSYDDERLLVATGNQHAGEIAAAALRAAVEQVLPEMQEPDWGACDHMHLDIELYTDHQRKRSALLAIATELEQQS